MSSFRRRLRYSTLALIVILLVTFDVGVYWGFHRVLHQYVDSRLMAMAEGWADIAGRNLTMLRDVAQRGQEAGMSSAVQGEGEQIEMREAALSIEVLALDGSVLWKGAAAVTTPPRDLRILEELKAGKKQFETVRNAAGVAVRRVWVPIVQGDRVSFLLQAETPLRLMEKALQGLAVLLAAASGLILLLAWLGSTWLARQALMPVEALSATAQKISEPSSLGTRLVLDAPYEEFRRLAHAFNMMMDRIQRVVESQRRFVADAAHEIHTPLTSLKGNLELALRKHRKASEYREALISNMAAVDRLINLSRSLLTLTKLVRPDAAASNRRLSLDPLLRELVDELAVVAQDRGIALRFEAGPSPAVVGNQEEIQRVVINVIDNAIRHTPAGGTITVRLGREAGAAVIVIRDTGEGISAEHLPHLFERFYRVDTARSQQSGGVGLGLAIVKEIVDAHGGDILLSSDVGKGTTVTIRLPGHEPICLDSAGRR